MASKFKAAPFFWRQRLAAVIPLNPMSEPRLHSNWGVLEPNKLMRGIYQVAMILGSGDIIAFGETGVWCGPVSDFHRVFEPLEQEHANA